MIERLLTALVRTGVKRGVRGSRPSWAIVGLAAFLVRRARSRRGPAVVYCEELGPGHTITVSHQARP